MAKPPLDVDATYTRILKLIQHSIRVTGRSQVEMDEAIGRPRGYLSHIFHGRIELKVRDFLRVLRALQIDPAQMLGPLVAGYPSGRGPLSQAELLVSLVRALPDPLAPAQAEADPEEAEKSAREHQKVLQQLRPMVSGYLDELLAEEKVPGEVRLQDDAGEQEGEQQEEGEQQAEEEGSAAGPSAGSPGRG